MGECLIVRRGGESYELPVLSASYPRDVTVTAAAGASASFSISITTPGRPAEYTYQWYRNGAAVSGGTAASLTLTGLTAPATYSVYCKVTNKAGSVNSRTATLTVRSYLPTYTYTGSQQLIDEGNFNWRLRLLTSGTLAFSHLGSAESSGAQVFLVGGGGGAGGFGAGGGGGYTRTVTVALATGTGYSIIVGAGGAAGGNAGGDSSALGQTVSGGRGGGYNFAAGGDGGSGGGGRPFGPGGVDGGNGGSGTIGDARGPGGNGQGSTTREFGSPEGTLYSSGGWGMDAAHTQDEAANTGNGGDSNGDNGMGGGSGIVVIRNTR
ncbi:MAG TPA: hypothetical protein IAD37_08320 [Candidatus Limiplasma merdipullorum]|nr:hypothetical protein [Candidatus Limiplasma merdipullorum]